MAGKMLGFLAIQMRNASATDALTVKVMLTVTIAPDVLVHTASFFFVLKAANRFLSAKCGEVTVDTAFAGACIAVNLPAKLLNGKLTIGMRFEESD